MMLQLIAAAAGSGIAYLSYRRNRRHQQVAPCPQRRQVTPVANHSHGRWRLWVARARVAAAVLPPDSIAGASINIASAALELATERRAGRRHGAEGSK